MELTVNLLRNHGFRKLLGKVHTISRAADSLRFSAYLCVRCVKRTFTTQRPQRYAECRKQSKLGTTRNGVTRSKKDWGEGPVINLQLSEYYGRTIPFLIFRCQAS